MCRRSCRGDRKMCERILSGCTGEHRACRGTCRVPEDINACESRKDERMPDRGNGMSGRLYRRCGNQHPGSESEEAACQLCQKFFHGNSGSSFFKSRIVSSILATVVVINALSPTSRTSCSFAVCRINSGATSFPRSITSKL